MTNSASGTLTPPDTTFDERRPCTRCEGQQALVASGGGFAKFVCDTCALTVGIDAAGDPPEFLLDRGLPRQYTKDVFGDRLQPQEMRVTAS